MNTLCTLTAAGLRSRNSVQLNRSTRESNALSHPGTGYCAVRMVFMSNFIPVLLTKHTTRSSV